ncbi:MAG: PQQ-dependent sugar dehydrogenase [Pirellulaceae bacterium]|jgi:putative heme-binding domain-containing protein|nr:PQQ-dependent sugar dehydrogenase [Pirellulaceae bacterium]
MTNPIVLRVTRHSIAAAAWLLILFVAAQLPAQKPDPAMIAKYRKATEEKAGEAKRGKTIFESKEAACSKCHLVEGRERKAGPPLAVIGDKLDRGQLINSVLEPNAQLHPDFVAINVTSKSGKVITGVQANRNDEELELLDGEGKSVRIKRSEIETESVSKTSLMPSDIYKTVTAVQFVDLIAYLETLQQKPGDERFPGMPNEIAAIDRPVRLEPLHSDKLKFDHPVCVITRPGSQGELMVVEQMTRKIWRLNYGENETRELFVDMSNESSTGQFEGVMCLAFHPRYQENGKYYLNYHIRQGGEFSPVIVERRTKSNRLEDAGGPSRRLLKIHQDTDLHWGGMLAFGPDGFLYIGAGDGGPQEDPEGHSQDLNLFLGSILRIDVDKPTSARPYSIPKSNPYRGAKGKIRPEIWASGFRMPWRFSFDGPTGDLWVGDIGQNLFEEVSIARVGENHGWNVYEAFTEFSDRYRRPNEQYTPPVIAYRRKLGVSVTGGYVYRGKRSPSYVGAYIFGDFESKRIWALTQKDRKLVKVRQIGSCPQKISSFGIDTDGELFVVGYEGTIYRLLLDDSVFE